MREPRGEIWELRDAGFGTKRFWFASSEPMSPDNPAKMLDKIFFTPRDLEEGALYGFRD